MSWEAATWAVEIGQERGLEPPKRHILLIMGNRADEAGYLFPSVAWICARTGYAERTVRQHLKELEMDGLLKRTARSNETGGRTSDGIQLTLRQPGLLPDRRPPAAGAPPPAADAPPPCSTGGVPPAGGAPDLKEDSKKKEKPPRGSKAPSAVAECWKAYAEAVKARHGIEPPTNAKSNGQLANIVGRVGAEGALQLVRFYVAHSDPFYVKTYHSLDYLVRDCDKRLWIEMGRQTGGRQAPVPTKAEVKFEYEGGQTRVLQDYPLGNPLEIAQQCKRDYARMVANTHPKNIVVQTGAQAHRYSIAELDTGRRA